MTQVHSLLDVDCRRERLDSGGVLIRNCTLHPGYAVPLAMRGVAVTVAFEVIELDPMVVVNPTHVDAPGANVVAMVVVGMEMAGSVTVTLPNVVLPVLVTR